MARATGPERRLLAIYTGGTIGMRSEGGGESVSPSPKQNSLRAGALGTLGLSLARGGRTLTPPVGSSGDWKSEAQVVEGVRGMATLPDLKYPRSFGAQKTALFCAWGTGKDAGTFHTLQPVKALRVRFLF